MPAISSKMCAHSPNTAYSTHVDGLSESEWNQMLSSFADASIYQTSAYGSVRWGEKNLSNLTIKQGQSIVAMAQVRIVKAPFGFSGFAYIRWAPLYQTGPIETHAQNLEQIVIALHEEYARRRGLLLRILPKIWDESEHAKVFETLRERIGASSFPSPKRYRTFLLDLSPSIDDLRKGLNGKWRNMLKRSEENGLTVQTGNDSEAYSIFKELYDGMLSRKQFETDVDVEQFLLINEQLPISLKLRIYNCFLDGEAICSIVTSCIGDTAIYLLGATNEKALAAKASYFTHWNIINWLKENGFRYYDLGGIDPEENPGGYRFKKGFSGEDLRHIDAIDCSRGSIRAKLFHCAVNLLKKMGKSL